MESEGRKIPVLYLVVPCYNEEEVVEKSARVMGDKLRRLIGEGKIRQGSKIMFVNDGSRDNTLRLLHQIASEDTLYSVVSLAGNYGHQSAILAGMMTAKDHADAVVTIDADLQQDIEALDKFLACYMGGSEVVYGVRNDRHSDGTFKKGSATIYYKLMHLLGSKVIANHADYRLMSKKALEALSEYRETNLFLRGLIPTMGFASDVVYFDVKKREAGRSKYTLGKMMTLAMDGITSMSVTPLRMIAVIGFIVCIFSFVMCIISLVDWMLGNNVPGYTTSLIVSLIMGGITLLSLGIIGEYIGKIYMETKKRPRYIIDTIVLKKNGEQSDND
ncbi:MAG: glycosyltransferase family 2 protein [Lachnospiraceae bacterium]|jgi:glycosyltransferase involved in cell wall biosynthesis|nr:glycosyltransferase family 2 protein [Lachnospiraceae bacterium]